MTAPHRRSRGQAHSRAIKESPGWARHQSELAAKRAEPPPTKWTPEENAAAQTKAAKSAGRRKLKPDPIAYLAACNFDLSGIRAQLRDAYCRGYVQALRDTKRERERMERASYVEAMPVASVQDLAEMSHAYASKV